MKNELQELALDLRALAAAEIDAAYVLALRAYLETGDDPPDPALYGLCLEEAQALVLQVLAIEIPDHGISRAA